jgi:predicted component of type VI protein secretion system
MLVVVGPLVLCYPRESQPWRRSWRHDVAMTTFVSLFGAAGPLGTFELDQYGSTMTIGRDPSADVCLTDPDRAISRRHVTLRANDEIVELSVVSATGVVETSAGTLLPGARAQLQVGDRFWFGPFTGVVRASDMPAQPDSQGPAAFDIDRMQSQASSEAYHSALVSEDPFEDWDDPLLGTEPSCASERPPRTDWGAVDLSGRQPSWAAFSQGLGVPEVLQFQPSQAEALGAALRVLFDGFTALSSAQSEFTSGLRAGEGHADGNTAANTGSAAAYTHWVGRFAAPGEGPQEAVHALRHALEALRSHFPALRSAVEAVLDGTLAEFSPDHLERPQPNEGNRVMSMLRTRQPWRAYRERHAQLSARRNEWRDEMLAKYFWQAYFSSRSDSERGGVSTTEQDENI